jgi:ABC-2 type transport system ATP-binding protein
MIEVENLAKSYGAHRVLRNASFQVGPGQITILTGDNGSGKTTTLRILAGLSRPDRGKALIAGHDIAKQRRSAQLNLSFMPQSPAFHPFMSPVRLARFYADLRGIGPGRVDAAMERFELLEELDKPVGHLSGGMLQRLALALLFLPDAPVLLLDEPGISLDPGWRARLVGLLQEEAARGKAVLLTTHLPDEWSRIGHRRLVCREGIVVSADEAGRLRGDTASEGTAGLAPDCSVYQ